MMERADELFDEQIHDAYERVTLSEEAQNRMLANLLAAQQEQAAEEATAAEPVAATAAEPVAATAAEPVATVAQERQETAQAASAAADKPKVLTARLAHAKWKVVMPIAAAVTAVALVVGVGSFVRASNSAPNAMMASESSSKADAVGANGNSMVDDAPQMGDPSLKETEGPAEATEVSLEEVDFTQQLGTVDQYPFIRLKDGTELTTLVDALFTEEVDKSRVGEKVGEAEAYAADIDKLVPCTVYRLNDDSEAFAVQYEGEESYWYCTHLPE